MPEIDAIPSHVLLGRFAHICRFNYDIYIYINPSNLEYDAISVRYASHVTEYLNGAERELRDFVRIHDV